MSINLRVSEIIKYKGLNGAKLAKMLNISTSAVSAWNNGGTISLQTITNIALLFPEINNHWLLTGEGEMIIQVKDDIKIRKDLSSKEESKLKKEKGIPLIPIVAMAGYGKGDTSVMKYEIEENYVIPEFRDKGVEFLIRASGSSMHPKYSNGDILACRPIKDLSFFQWGKVYVLDTDQGPVVKRLFHCDDEDSVECHSDNKTHYPPFKIKKSSIRNVSIVVGVIRLE